MPDKTAPIAYLTGEYPAISHTFILREIAALRAQGRDVLPCAIRRTGPEHLRGAAEAEEAARTFYVLAAAKNPLTLLSAQAAALRTPGRWWAALRLALGTAPPGLQAGLYQLFYFLEAAVLARHLRARGVRHLHNHFANSSCTVAMLASTLSGIPFSLTLHGPAIFFEPRHWRIDEKIARARFTACISHFCRSQGMIFADPAHWSRMHIVHCGVTAARYGRAPDLASGKRLIFVGRLAAVKGVLVLLEALARVRADHPDVTLTLVGDGNERPRIEARVAELDLAGVVTFRGYLDQEEVRAELSRADLFVLPSFAEGVPVVLMEAMASRLPVVATRIAGIGELVTEGETGRLVPPGDVEALAGAIGALLSDPALCTEMGKSGRNRVETDFDIDREAGWLGQLIDGTAGPVLRPGGAE